MLSGTYYVYIVVDPYGTFRVGVTNDLATRLLEYRRTEPVRGAPTRLLYYEILTNLSAAIAREQVLKTWRRGRKKRLINAVNPQWQDLLGARS